MTFQKARILAGEEVEPQQIVGAELWVRIGPPEMRLIQSRIFPESLPYRAMTYESPYIDDDGRHIMIEKDYVELLPEIGQDIPDRLFEDWLKENTGMGLKDLMSDADRRARPEQN